MNKLIIYGDIHGCYDEFTSLRKKINPQKNDIEVCVGDIITKGIDSIKSLDFIIEHKIQSVLGNHEDKLLRYLVHQKSNKKNPITLDVDEQNIIDNLTNEHIQYLESLPLCLKFANITIVHGGIQNHIDLNNLSKREIQNILRLRYLDKEENFIAYGKEDERSIFWADIYNGSNGFIVYGHQWFQDVKKNKYSLGIDTGCVYGNKLSAAIFELKEDIFIYKMVLDFNKTIDKKGKRISFDTDSHQAVQSEDGSFTAYSKEFEEHYHSTKDGALEESLQKHVIPALTHHHDKEELTILDICFGLGFNTLATLYHMKQMGIHKKLTIYSPEFDKELIASLKTFPYPKIFDQFKKIITALSEHGEYTDNFLHVRIYLGDAREFLVTCKEHFDIVYQDAFSPATNPILWTQEYFNDIKKVMKKDAILTTYSISLPSRLALFYNGFYIYLLETKNCRSSTLASLSSLSEYKRVDMEHKIACNPDAKPLRDLALI